MDGFTSFTHFWENLSLCLFFSFSKMIGTIEFLILKKWDAIFFFFLVG